MKQNRIIFFLVLVRPVEKMVIFHVCSIWGMFDFQTLKASYVPKTRLFSVGT